MFKKKTYEKNNPVTDYQNFIFLKNMLHINFLYLSYLLAISSEFSTWSRELGFDWRASITGLACDAN